eukprot:12820.XXX_792290_792619_1 [CDS] Oithona nana genome sequencing.
MNTSWIWIGSIACLLASCKSCLEPAGPLFFLGKGQKKPLLQLSSTHLAPHVIIQKLRMFIKEGFNDAVNALLWYLFSLNSVLIRSCLASLVTNATFSLRVMMQIRIGDW